MLKFTLKSIAVLGILSIEFMLVSAVQAQQVIPDNTLNTDVTRSGNAFTITDGTLRGTNLFHSFREFSIPSGGSATFDLTNTPNASKIFSRVTGSNVSSLDGILRVAGNADLFLLNPNGILLGPGAKLDLNGSLILSTANSVVFGTQGEFKATETSLPLLTIQPSALWFSGKPQPIVASGNSPGLTRNIVAYEPAQLQAPPERSFVLAGGDIHLVGADIGVDRSQITLTGLATSGQIALSQSGNYWNAQPISPSSLANLSLTQGSIISAGQGQESRILLQGNIVSLSDQSSLKVATFDRFPGGTIDIRASEFNVANRSLVASDSFKDGSPGKVTINATRSLLLDQSLMSVTTYVTSLIGGEFTINTGHLSVIRGGIIGTSTFYSGNAGSIRINADSVEVKGSGSAVYLTLIRPSTIESAAFSLPEISKALNLPEVPPSGKAGDITINTNQLLLSDRGQISVRHEGTGNAGDLRITANKIQIDRSGLLSAGTKSGEGGNINLQTQLLLMRDRGQVIAAAQGTGNGGNIKISAPLIVGLENSDIIARAVQGRGGNIQITTQGILGLKYRDRETPESDITASSDFGIHGTVEVKNIGLDPNSGLIELSETLQDRNQKMADGCTSDQNSSFVMTGRGGIPTTPSRSKINRTWNDFRPIAPSLTIAHQTMNPAISQFNPWLEATAWRQNPQTSEMELFAPQALQSDPIATCQPHRVTKAAD